MLTRMSRAVQSWLALQTCLIFPVIIALALLLSLASAEAATAPRLALGETGGHETQCFQMTPYEDELALSWAYVAPKEINFYAVFAQWWGNGHYGIEGAGDAQFTHNGNRQSISVVFFNHTELGSGNRWGRLAASIHLKTRQGPWTLAITGDGRPEGGGSATPYWITGFLVPKPCSQLGTVPRGDPPNLALAPSE
jgi:hypothetical protein